MKKIEERIKLATIIQNYWRKNSFFIPIFTLLNSTPTEINQGLFNIIFSRMIKYCERLQV